MPTVSFWSREPCLAEAGVPLVLLAALDELGDCLFVLRLGKVEDFVSVLEGRRPVWSGLFRRDQVHGKLPSADLFENGAIQCELESVAELPGFGLKAGKITGRLQIYNPEIAVEPVEANLHGKPAEVLDADCAFRLAVFK